MKNKNFFIGGYNPRKIIKEVMIPLALTLFIIGMVLTIVNPVQAQNSNDVFEGLKQVGQQSQLPSYQTNAHANSSYESGASNITSALFYAIDFLKYGMGSVAIITLIISGIKLVTAGKQIDDVSGKQKEHFKYALIGLIVIILADQVVQVFFGSQGEIFGSKSQLQTAAELGSEKVKGIYSAAESVAGVLAILMLVISGFRLVISGGNEEVQTKSKKNIMYSVIGLVLLGISEFVIKDLIFPKQGNAISDIEKTKQFVVTMTNFVAGFISTIATVMYIYGGYLYVTAVGNEEGTSKAKKVFIGATIGLLLAMAAFAIVNTIVKLEPTSGIEQSGSASPATLPTNPGV